MAENSMVSDSFFVPNTNEWVHGGYIYLLHVGIFPTRGELGTVQVAPFEQVPQIRCEITNLSEYTKRVPTILFTLLNQVVISLRAGSVYSFHVDYNRKPLCQ